MKNFHINIVKYEIISYNQNMKTIFRDLRKEKSLTQMELAKILNIDQTTVSKWEVGKAIPDYDTLQRLADFYNVSVDYLLGRENKHFVNPTFEHNTAKLKLKELREQKGITQEKLANELGLTRSVISMYEINASEPDLETLCKIAAYFYVSVDYLLGRETLSTAPDQQANEPLSDNAIEMLKTFNQLSNDSQIMCIGFAEQFLRHDLEQQQKTKDKNFNIRKIK